MRILGVILIVLGLLSLQFGGLSYTSKEKVVDLGPLQLTQQETRTLPIAPLVSGAALLVGLVLVIAGSRRRK